jgi:hypothetical protein
MAITLRTMAPGTDAESAPPITAPDRGRAGRRLVGKPIAHALRCSPAINRL